jgi:hypothetical protein
MIEPSIAAAAQNTTLNLQESPMDTLECLFTHKSILRHKSAGAGILPPKRQAVASANFNAIDRCQLVNTQSEEQVNYPASQAMKP